MTEADPTTSLHGDGAEDAPRRRLILVVEDTPSNLMVAKAQLSLMGYDVVSATNGREAVEQYESGAYDIVLMDIQMPHMNGFEAARHIREIAGDSITPIVAMTAGGSNVNRSSALDAGMNDFVSKPVDWPALRTMLDNFLGR